MIDKQAALEWAFETATEVVLVKEISQENDSKIMECLIKHNWPFVKSLIENNKSLSSENKKNAIDWLESHYEKKIPRHIDEFISHFCSLPNPEIIKSSKNKEK